MVNGTSKETRDSLKASTLRRAVIVEADDSRTHWRDSGAVRCIEGVGGRRGRKRRRAAFRKVGGR